MMSGVWDAKWSSKGGGVRFERTGKELRLRSQWALKAIYTAELKCTCKEWESRVRS